MDCKGRKDGKQILSFTFEKLSDSSVALAMEISLALPPYSFTYLGGHDFSSWLSLNCLVNVQSVALTLPSPQDSGSTVVSELPFLLQVSTTIPQNPTHQNFWKQTAEDKHSKLHTNVVHPVNRYF